MDRLEELSIFVAIVEAGSLAGAARRLRRSPPAVTRALSTLEARAGARLIERTTRRLAPTEVGRALAERARNLLGAYKESLAGALPARVGGMLRITAPVQFGRRHVAPVVTDFLTEYPEVRVELSLNDRNVDLIEEGLDLAVRIGALADSGLVARPLGNVRRVVVASPTYLSRRGIPQNPSELASHDTIFGMTRSSAREWRFPPSTRKGERSKRSARGAIVRLSPRFLVDDVEVQLDAARAGRGIARVLSYQVAGELAAGSLVRILKDFEPAPLPVQLVTPSRGSVPKVRAFLDFAAQGLRGGWDGAGR